MSTKSPEEKAQKKEHNAKRKQQTQPATEPPKKKAKDTTESVQPLDEGQIEEITNFITIQGGQVEGGSLAFIGKMKKKQLAIHFSIHEADAGPGGPFYVMLPGGTFDPNLVRS